jgi:kinesin family protein 18/19
VDDRVLVFDPPEENPIAQYSKTIVAGGRKTKDMRYAFDRVFDETCTQEDVRTLRNLADVRYSRILLNRFWMVFLMDSMQLYLLTVLLGVERHIPSGPLLQRFGLIGSGNPDNPGIIYLTTQELFDRCAALTDKTVTVSLSFLEIYNETIRDLLVSVEGSKPLLLREDAQQKISVPGLTTASPANVCDVFSLSLL